MTSRAAILAGCLLLLMFAVGCSSGPERTSTGKGTSRNESVTSGRTDNGTAAREASAVRDAFTTFQAALKDKQADAVWKLLDKQSQTDAEAAARAVRSNYAKADAETKAKQAKALGLPEAEVAGLNGVGFLKTELFRHKYDEVPGSKILNVSLDGDKATVHYQEEDADKEELSFTREGGQWKVVAAMPRVK